MGQGQSVTKQEPWGPAGDFAKGTVFPAAKSIWEAPYQAYTGPYAPGMSDYTKQAGQTYGAAAGMTPETLGANTQALMSPYTQNVIDTSLAQMDLQQGKARTGMEANLIGGGAFGSRGEVARGEFEAQNLAQRNNLIANLMQQGYGQAQAAAMAMQQQQLAGAGGLMGVGAADTALAGADIAGQKAEFDYSRNLPYQKFGILSGGAASAPAGGTTTDQYNPGLLDYVTAGARIFSGLPF